MTSGTSSRQHCVEEYREPKHLSILLEDERMTTEVFEVQKVTVIPEITEREAEETHVRNQVAVGDAPLPKVMDVSVWAPVCGRNLIGSIDCCPINSLIATRRDARQELL